MGLLNILKTTMYPRHEVLVQKVFIIILYFIIVIWLNGTAYIRLVGSSMVLSP